jgi:hypothetical protein
VNHDAFQSWLDRYIAAWRSNDRTDIEALFTPDAAYRWHPWDEPIRGGGAIADAWLESPDEPDSWQAEYRPLAIDPDGTHVSVGTSTYLNDDRSAVAHVYHNVFVCRFDDDGRCRDFTEFFAEQPIKAATTA